MIAASTAIQRQQNESLPPQGRNKQQHDDAHKHEASGGRFRRADNNIRTQVLSLVEIRSYRSGSHVEDWNCADGRDLPVDCWPTHRAISAEQIKLKAESIVAAIWRNVGRTSNTPSRPVCIERPDAIQCFIKTLAESRKIPTPTNTVPHHIDRQLFVSIIISETAECGCGGVCIATAAANKRQVARSDGIRFRRPSIEEQFQQQKQYG
jgi:hypothetical protein